ncbi:hypothetical protein K505DRAFT_158489 [Melanomma pulvis-pyrius CBS 109.77]|uniref:C2H2-type domain-containing protein n=1 Tax=Melanomma pulvis-pyrius CBS 109.77 TaxID=1314802 RepID=A0A6A6WPQ3_9PLEO|nr:hypothetical protein K505DRAFT_158489 [Melanomma pulvis-pyrius CBS 109.77]
MNPFPPRITISSLLNPVKSYQCGCGREFRRKGNYTMHLAAVHIKEKLLGCPTCQRPFFRRKDLNRHQASVHTDEAPYMCGCGKAFKRNDSLTKHQRACYYATSVIGSDVIILLG